MQNQTNISILEITLFLSMIILSTLALLTFAPSIQALWNEIINTTLAELGNHISKTTANP